MTKHNSQNTTAQHLQNTIAKKRLLENTIAIQNLRDITAKHNCKTHFATKNAKRMCKTQNVTHNSNIQLQNAIAKQNCKTQLQNIIAKNKLQKNIAKHNCKTRFAAHSCNTQIQNTIAKHNLSNTIVKHKFATRNMSADPPPAQREKIISEHMTWDQVGRPPRAPKPNVKNTIKSRYRLRLTLGNKRTHNKAILLESIGLCDPEHRTDPNFCGDVLLSQIGSTMQLYQPELLPATPMQKQWIVWCTFKPALNQHGPLPLLWSVVVHLFVMFTKPQVRYPFCAQKIHVSGFASQSACAR